MTGERRPDMDSDSADGPAQPGVGDGPAAEATFSEGVGGLPDLDDDERATVGDPDGDNVVDGEEI